MRVETIGNATLYLGDCREILPTLPKVDAVVTDPPYGIDFKGKATKRTAASGGYIGGDSDIGPILAPAFLERAARGVVFSGSRLLHKYPEPYEISGIYTPSGAGLGRWGFTVMHPVLFYGKALKHGIQSPAGIESFDLASDNRHPCAKPLRWMEWAVTKSTIQGQSVLDPFMGSGTTGVACMNLGRKFIGIEIETMYFDIACERIRASHAQQRMFP